MRELWLTFAFRFGITLASVLATVANVGDVAANGTPHRVVLTYISSLSNWGPTTATGVAEVVPKEGTVSISIVGLPSLADDKYVIWLINTRTSQAMNVGSFNTDKDSIAKAELTLPSEIPDFGWNLLLLTVEPGGQIAQAPGPRKSIGGYIIESGENRPVPGQLPKTGGDTDTTVARTNPPGLLKETRSVSGPAWDTARYLAIIGAVALVGAAIAVRARRN